MKIRFPLFIVATLLSYALNASPRFHFPKKAHEYDKGGPETRGLSFGYSAFKSQALNNYLQSFGKAGSFKNNYLMVGIENISSVNRVDMVVSTSWILPQNAYAGSNDSLRFRFSGWQLMTSFLGYDLVKGDAFAFVIGPAFTWGNYHLDKYVGASKKQKYRDPVVAPGGRVDMRLNLGGFFIGGRAVY